MTNKKTKWKSALVILLVRSLARSEWGCRLVGSDAGCYLEQQYLTYSSHITTERREWKARGEQSVGSERQLHTSIYLSTYTRTRNARLPSHDSYRASVGRRVLRSKSTDPLTRRQPASQPASRTGAPRQLHLVRQLCTHHPLSKSNRTGERNECGGISESSSSRSALVNRRADANTLLGTYGGPSNNYNPLRR